jgi:transposase InsO family protein
MLVTELCNRFKEEPLFLEIIEALFSLDSDKPERERRRAKHRALGYIVEDGRLWRIADGKSTRARARVECVTKKEAMVLAKEAHENNGHWGRDLTKLQLMDRIASPSLDQSIVTALLECPQCKNFGSTQLHALLYPITRRHPFELLVADYLSLPKSKGGYHNVLLILDTYSQYVWGFKLKTYGTAKTTIAGLDAIVHSFRAPETFMTDGGSHFDNGDVRAWCSAHDAKHQVVAAYSPWVNGLVENANSKLLGRLKRLCNQGVGEDEEVNTKAEDLTWKWPDHFDKAIRQLNERIIPAFQFSPKELLLGLVVNTTPTAVADANNELTVSEVNVHMAYVDQQRLDGASHIAAHATKRKSVFDKKVLRSHAGEVIFEPGQLVQVYANATEMTMASSKKLIPRWSAPRRVVSRISNSYTLTSLEGFPINGLFHARRLRRFIPRNGTALAELEEALQNKGADEAEDEAGDIQSKLGTISEDDPESEEDIEREDVVEAVASA